VPFFLWQDLKGFILEHCPKCAELYGYEPEALRKKGLTALFQKDCKIKRILSRQKFDLNNPLFPAEGICRYERRLRGSEFRKELALKRVNPDYLIDSEIIRHARQVELYGKKHVQNAIFIMRFEVVNLTKLKPISHRYHIRWVPAFISSRAPYGLMQAVSPKEPESELEKLLFTGGSKIKPKYEIATKIR